MKEKLHKLKARILGSRALLGLTVFAGFMLVATLVVATAPSPQPQERLEKAWPVSITVAEPGSMTPTLVTFGKVESRQVANLKTSITAPVDKLLVAEGEWVNEGQPLIALEQRELKLALTMADAEYQRRTAQLASVKTDYELANQLTEHHQSLKDISDAKLKRHLDLYQNKMVSDEVLDEARRIASERSMTLAQHLARVTDFPNQIAQAEAAVTEAGAMLEQARINLEQTTLQAPFRGRIIALNVAPGDRVFQGTTLVQIADYDQLEVRATIPADQGARLRTQLEAGAKVSARGRLHGQQIRFVLDRISGDVKPGQAGIDGFFRPEADQQLDIGRVINLHVTLPAEEQVLALPVQSLYENDRIYRVVDSRLQGLDVERVGDHITAEGEYRVLIRSEAIDAGDRLITTQLPRAITGLLVEPIDASEFVQAVAGKDSGQ